MRLKATLSGFVASSASACLILVSLLAYSTQTHAFSSGKTYYDRPNCEGQPLAFPGDADPWRAEELGADSFLEHGTCYNIERNSFWQATGCRAAIVGGSAVVIGGISAAFGGPKGFIAGAVVGGLLAVGGMIISDTADSLCRGQITPA